MNFLSVYSEVKSLTAEPFEEVLSGNALNVLMNQPNLKCMKLSGYEETMKTINSKIVRNYKDSKQLKVSLVNVFDFGKEMFVVEEVFYSFLLKNLFSKSSQKKIKCLSSENVMKHKDADHLKFAGRKVSSTSLLLCFQQLFFSMKFY